MTAHHRHAIADPNSLRILEKRYGSLLGPEYIVAVCGKYYRVGYLTLLRLENGIDPAELDLLEVDPDEDREEY